ncbi:hypothetical protein CY35_19G061000 [Sphagnum magellanicum]|nr:hypothetical protein CY35_19G061000 [Sphagnum magellanicum]
MSCARVCGGGRGRERECARKKMKIGGVQSSTYKQFQLRRRRQDQRWPQGQWHGSGDDGVRICRARTGVELHACLQT